MKKYILPFGILLLTIFVTWVIFSNPPSSKRGRPKQAPQLSVAVETLTAQNYVVNVNSYGTVKPRTQSVLLPQVSGQITYISDNFRDGGFFSQGEVLLKLDQRDYQAEIQIAQANVFSAQQALIEEQARVEQAKQDWQRLGNNQPATDLVLRKPQLLAAQARVNSAEASLSKANLSLERTQIIAPYTGRILKKLVDLGQVVSPSTRLADIYAVDYVEIRLPIKNKDLAYMQLPENNAKDSVVRFNSDLFNQKNLQGHVVRTEGAFDTASQQLFVVAQIDDPYGVANKEKAKKDNNATATQIPLKIGQYLTASIVGKTVENALVIPNKTIYQGSYVYIVDNNQLKRQEITIAWQNEKSALVASGLKIGELLVTTPLGQVNSGTPVSIESKDGQTLIAKGPAKSRQPKSDKRKNKASTGAQQ